MWLLLKARHLRHPPMREEAELLSNMTHVNKRWDHLWMQRLLHRLPALIGRDQPTDLSPPQPFLIDLFPAKSRCSFPVMAEVRTCEPFELFNLLNQCRNASRLADLNYLYLVDARVLQDYNTSHILAAKSGKMDSDGNFVLPGGVEVDSMQHVVVYDSDTRSLRENSRAVACAQVLAKVSLCPVCVVRGGYQRFSALYPFLRTEKMMYTYMELENLKIYPMEIIAEQLYMGDLKQAVDPGVLAHLKITTIISISQSDTLEAVKENRTILNIPVADSVHSDLYSSFKRVCGFIESQINMNSRVLVVSKQGRSRCSAVVIAFVMQHLKYTLEEAWNYLVTCKPNMRPNTGFLQQLSDWELHLTGAKLTDISETLF